MGERVEAGNGDVFIFVILVYIYIYISHFPSIQVLSLAFRCYVCSKATACSHILDFALLLFAFSQIDATNMFVSVGPVCLCNNWDNCTVMMMLDCLQVVLPGSNYNTCKQ